MTTTNEIFQQTANLKDFTKALQAILTNRGRKADSIAEWDVLDALEQTNLRLEANDG